MQGVRLSCGIIANAVDLRVRANWTTLKLHLAINEMNKQQLNDTIDGWRINAITPTPPQDNTVNSLAPGKYGSNLKTRTSKLMMTSSNGNIFRVTGPLCGEFTVPVSSPHKGQWRGALMFSLICVWLNGWVNNREAGNLSRNRGHYDVIVMSHKTVVWALAVKLLSGECHRTSPGQHWLTRLLGAIIYSSQHWFRYRVGVIYRTKIDSDLCCHMASLGHNKLSVDLAYIFFVILSKFENLNVTIYDPYDMCVNHTNTPIRCHITQ